MRRTLVKTFKATNTIQLDEQINKYADEQRLEIVSCSLSMVDDMYVVMCIFSKIVLCES